MPGVLPFAVLPHHDPVDPLRGGVAQWARHSRQEPHRPHAGVLIESLADGQAQAPQADVIGHARASRRRRSRWRRTACRCSSPSGSIMRPVSQVVLASPGKRLERETEAAAARSASRSRTRSPSGMTSDADAVARDHRNAVDAFLLFVHDPSFGSLLSPASPRNPDMGRSGLNGSSRPPRSPSSPALLPLRWEKGVFTRNVRS